MPVLCSVLPDFFGHMCSYLPLSGSVAYVTFATPQTSLSACRMSGNMYTLRDKDLERLQAFKRLQSLDLSQCGALTDLAGLQRLPKLQNLELNCCTGLTAGALRVLAQLPGLRKLDFSCCCGLTDDCMASITGTLTSMSTYCSPGVGSGLSRNLRKPNKYLQTISRYPDAKTQLGLSLLHELH